MTQQKAKYERRREMFDQAIHFQPHEQTPNVSNFWTWKILDAGYKLSEACTDWSVMEKVQRHHFETYDFDSYCDLGGRNANGMMRALGRERHIIDDESEAVFVHDLSYAESEEDILEYLRDPVKFKWTRNLPEYLPDFTKGNLYDGVQELFKYMDYLGRINTISEEEYAAPLWNGPIPTIPAESYFGARGMKNASIDLRRRTDFVQECVDLVTENSRKELQNNMIQADTSRYIFDGFFPCLSHTFLNRKQFERFYWPFLKEAYEAAHQAGKTFFVHSEGSVLRLADFYQDIPKGVIGMLPELDDIFECRRQMPNLCLIGGIQNTTLNDGTPEQCVAMAKQAIDELGDGLILTQNKMGSYRNDGKAENVLAVNEFVRSYRR